MLLHISTVCLITCWCYYDYQNHKNNGIRSQQYCLLTWRKGYILPKLSGKCILLASSSYNSESTGVRTLLYWRIRGKRKRRRRIKRRREKGEGKKSQRKLWPIFWTQQTRSFIGLIPIYFSSVLAKVFTIKAILISISNMGSSVYKLRQICLINPLLNCCICV